MGFFKKLYLLIFFISTSAYSAENINKSLISAYLNNPKINAERERTKAVDESLVQAFSAFKPTVTISAYKSDTDSSKITTSTGSPSPSTNVQTTAKSITIEQKLFNFNDMYNYQKEKNSVEIARYTLKKAEQDILLEAAEAYASTLLAQKKLIFNKENLDLSEKQVDLDKSRLELGIITISDLAQSESSLAAAQSNLLNAENELLIAKKNFKNVIGYDPVDLDELKDLNLNLPKSLEETSVSALKDNPILKISEFSLKKAEDEYRIALAELSPTFSLSLGITDYDGYSSSVDKTKQSIAKAQASIPLYQGGKQTSLIIQKKSLLDSAELDLQNSKNVVDRDSYSAWSNYRLSISNAELTKLRVKASEIAYEGIIQEYETGSRSTLDVITSRSTLLESRVNNAISDKDRIVSQFKLLSSIGGLTAKNLALETKLYDPNDYPNKSWIRHIF